MRRLIFICSVLASIAGTSAAQTYTQTPVTVSTEKVRGDDGKIYYSHVVLEKQTLFSIAKAYGVTVDDICTANPGLNLRAEGLKKNSIVLIPASVSATARPDATGEVQEEQTADMQAQDTAAQAKTAYRDKDGVVRVHVAKWYEDLDDIAYRYSVPKDILMEYNGLTDSKLKRRQRIRIPSGETIVKMMAGRPAEPAVPQQEADTETSSGEQSGRRELSGEHEVTHNRHTGVKALLMLPFGASSAVSENNMDFYCGVLLAVKDLGEEGTETDLSVYDVADGAMPITADRLRMSDFTIGPVDADGLGKVLDLAPESTCVISPLDHRTASLVRGNRNFIQAPASAETQYGDLLDWLAGERSNGDKVIIIREKGVSTDAISMMDSLIACSGIPYTNYSYNILYGRNVSGALAGMMTSAGTNRVIINSESEAFVNDAVRNLNMMLHRKFDVILYSPSRIRSFETIDVESLHNLNTRIATSYYIDYENPAVMRFLMQYRALYGTEPTRFSFQGYDLAHFFINMKSKYGNAWLRHAGNAGSTALMQTDMKLRGTVDGGYVNKGVRRVVYGPDYSVSIAGSN